MALPILLDVKKNVTVLKSEDVEMRNGEVLTPNHMIMDTIRKKEGQYKRQIYLSSSMDKSAVRRTLEQNLPILQGKRFWCAARESQNNAKLDFNGNRGVWDGKTLKKRLKGSSALYIVIADELLQQFSTTTSDGAINSTEANQVVVSRSSGSQPTSSSQQVSVAQPYVSQGASSTVTYADMSNSTRNPMDLTSGDDSTLNLIGLSNLGLQVSLDQPHLFEVATTVASDLNTRNSTGHYLNQISWNSQDNQQVFSPQSHLPQVVVKATSLDTSNSTDISGHELNQISYDTGDTPQGLGAQTYVPQVETPVTSLDTTYLTGTGVDWSFQDLIPGTFSNDVLTELFAEFDCTDTYDVQGIGPEKFVDDMDREQQSEQAGTATGNLSFTKGNREQRKQQNQVPVTFSDACQRSDSGLSSSEEIMSQDERLGRHNTLQGNKVTTKPIKRLFEIQNQVAATSTNACQISEESTSLAQGLDQPGALQEDELQFQMATTSTNAFQRLDSGLSSEEYHNQDLDGHRIPQGDDVTVKSSKGPLKLRGNQQSSTDSDATERSDSSLSAEESMSLAQVLDQPGVLHEDDAKIHPSNGPLQGGGSFYVEFNKKLLPSVKEGWAIFGRKRVQMWQTSEGCVMFGKEIPSGDAPGPVSVTFTTLNGDLLGKATFTYNDLPPGVMEMMEQFKRKMEEALEDSTKRCKILSNKNNDRNENARGDSHLSGLPNEGTHLQSVNVLRPLIYAVVKIGAYETIRFIFNSSVRKVIFESYRKDFTLSEDTVEDYSHKEIAVYLRRFSEEEKIHQLQSKDIDSNKLARAVEESQTQPAEPFDITVLEQVPKDVPDEEYFGDTEASSDSEEERPDYEDVSEPTNVIERIVGKGEAKGKLTDDVTDITAAFKGHAGVGKSIFCQKMVHDWATEKEHVAFSIPFCKLPFPRCSGIKSKKSKTQAGSFDETVSRQVMKDDVSETNSFRESELSSDLEKERPHIDEASIGKQDEEQQNYNEVDPQEKCFLEIASFRAEMKCKWYISSTRQWISDNVETWLSKCSQAKRIDFSCLPYSIYDVSKKCNAGNQAYLDRANEGKTIDPRCCVITEFQLADISDDVGTCWRELGQKLKISASKIQNLDDEYRCNRDKANALLITWKQQQGSSAVAGRLADALESIGQKRIAEQLLGSFDETVSRQVMKDDVSETNYFGESELSSDFEKERPDFEDQLKRYIDEDISEPTNVIERIVGKGEAKSKLTDDVTDMTAVFKGHADIGKSIYCQKLVYDWAAQKEHVVISIPFCKLPFPRCSGIKSKKRKTQTADCSINKFNPKLRMTEDIIHGHQLPELIGDKWKKLARALRCNEADIREVENERGNSNEECCIGVLVHWMHREAGDATVGKLAEALIKIKLKSVAVILCPLSPGKEDELAGPNDSDQIEKRINEIETNCQLLKEECHKLRTRNLVLEAELAGVKQQLQDTSKESQKLHARNLELEEELAGLRQDISQQTFMVVPEEKDSDETRDYQYPDQANSERQITVQLKELNELLYTSVTSPLQVPEVREDKLKTSVKLDLLTRLSVSLQGLYSTTLSMVAEACKCSEDVKREFYDFAYHGLRAEHNDLAHRVEDLRSAQEEMSEEEKNYFKRLQQFQTNRQRQVDRLEKLWRGLFSPPESLPQTTCSEPPGAGGKSSDCKKHFASGAQALRRQCTDPGIKQQRKSFEQTTCSGPSTSDDDKFEVRITKFKRTTVKNIFRRKDSKENTCYPVSYSQITHRDS